MKMTTSPKKTCPATRQVGHVWNFTCMLEDGHRGTTNPVTHEPGKLTNHRMVIPGIAVIYWISE